MNIVKRVGRTVAYAFGMLALFLVASITSAYALEIDGIVQTQSQVDLDTEVRTDVGTSVDADLDADATTSVDVEEDSDSTTTAEVTVDDVLGASIMVSRGDLPETTGAMVGASDPAEVNDANTFRVYALGLLEQDEFLKEVESEEEEVSVTYAQRAELFGFIPVYVNTEVSVNAQGEVDVDYPWYRFLTDVERQGLEEDLNSRISLILGADTDPTATTTVDGTVESEFDLQQQAEVVEAVYRELRESFAAEIEAEGEADTSIAS